MNQILTFDKLYILDSMGFGCWFRSREPKLVVGTVRYIRGQLFYVYNQYTGLNRNGTSWCPINPALNTIDNMSKFRNQVLAGNNEIVF